MERTKIEKKVAESQDGVKTRSESGVEDVIDYSSYEPRFTPGEVVYWSQIPRAVKETLRNYYTQKDPSGLEGMEKKRCETTPELRAVALLEYLSSQRGEIRRTGSTYRSEDYDVELIEIMANSIKQGKPVELFGLALSPKFRNPEISNRQLMPDMADYLALVNLHRISGGAKKVYEHGIKINIAYEGQLYRALGRYTEEETKKTFDILNDLNNKANKLVDSKHEPSDNSVNLVNATDIVRDCLIDNHENDEIPFKEKLKNARLEIEREYKGKIDYMNQYLLETQEGLQELGEETPMESLRKTGKLFSVLVSISKKIKSKQLESELYDETSSDNLGALIEAVNCIGELESWMSFYRDTLSQDMFKTDKARDSYVKRMAFYYKAFNQIKYQGGVENKGILGAFPDAIPITVQGTPNKMNLQLVPGFDHFPHHRLTGRALKKTKKGQMVYEWQPLRYSEITKGGKVFIPRYIEEYEHPFYYEELKPIEDVAENENMNQEASMGASLTIMESEAGDRFVVKREEYSSKPEGLLRQIGRMQAMREDGVDIVPEIIDENVKESELYYVMPYVGGGSISERLFSDEVGKEDFGNRFDKLLDTLNKGLWSKKGGEALRENDNFSKRHSFSVQRGIEGLRTNENEELQNIESNSLITVNGQEFVNLPIIFDILNQSEEGLDTFFEDSLIPEHSHGDLHFGNIIGKEDKPMLIDVNGRQERDRSSIEFELSRLILSFYREIIRNHEYSIEVNPDSSVDFSLTDRGEEILEKRNIALESILSNPSLDKWLPDKSKSLDKILLLEALDIASVFHQRSDKEEQVATYLIGTSLFNDVINTSDCCDVAVWNNMRGLLTPESYQDQSTYQEVNGVFNALMAKKYEGYAINHMFGEFVITSLEKDGSATTFFLDRPDLPDSVLAGGTMTRDKSGSTVNKRKFQDMLKVWQKVNFPENQTNKLFTSFPEHQSRLLQALHNETPVNIGNKTYQIEGVLGIGKESIALEAKNEQSEKFAIKIGLQYLEDEYSFAKELEAQLNPDQRKRFRSYVDYDREQNIIVMELVEGRLAEDDVRSMKEPGDWVNFLHSISDVIGDIAELNQRGLFAGQFNLRNVMIDQEGSYRIIDPLYEGEADVYEAKQMARIVGVLVQKIYKTDPGTFPLEVKSSNDADILRGLKYPPAELIKLQDKEVGIPEPINSELIRIFRKYLSNGSGDKTLSEMAEDFRGLGKLCEKYEVMENSDALVFERSPRAILLDFNGTIEDSGFINKRLVDNLSRLQERGVRVGIVSGKRQESIEKVCRQNDFDISAFDVFTDDGSALYNGHEIKMEVPIEELSSKLGALEAWVKEYSPQTRIRHNNRRINFLNTDGFSEEAKSGIDHIASELNLKAVSTNNGTQFDFIMPEAGKAWAIEYFRDQYGLEDGDILKIGNEPTENDKELLYKEDGSSLRENGMIISSVAETAYLIEKAMDEVGYGATKKSGKIQFVSGSLTDFCESKLTERELLDQAARSSSNVFYPYFALKERLRKRDSKTVDFKWMIRNSEGGPVGVTALYELPDQPGFYNIGGMFLTPETRGQGMATSVIDQLSKYAQDNIKGFKGFKVRVAEVNVASRKLVEKCGFKPTEVRLDDYDLVVEGESVKVATIVYELSDADNDIDLSECKDLLPSEKAKEVYLEYCQKKA